MPDDLASLKARLDTINGEALRDAEREALRGVGQLVQSAIVSRAPERTEQSGGDLAPGELKASFKVSIHIAADSGTAKGDTSRVTVAPTGNAEHVARFVENGHANRPGSKTANTPAHPFVRPAFEETEQAAIDLYTSTLTASIQEIFNV